LFNWCSFRVDSTAEDHSEEAEDALIEKDEKNTHQAAFVIAKIVSMMNGPLTMI
jgi:hypothetical protein